MEIPASTSQTTITAAVQQKRRASPIQQRNVKPQCISTPTTDVTMMNDATTSVTPTDTAPTTANPITQGNSPISNIHFATFKNLRKLNSKVVTANHHLEFLRSLKERNLVPKGLQVKAVNIGLELPSDLYEQWENSHIKLANDRRDILIEYWDRQINTLESSIIEAQPRLAQIATEDEIEKITGTLERTKITKTNELKARRLQKAANVAAASGGGQNPQV